ncbi:MAG TPA: amidohydrolase family protein [Gemmatimonadales bacterium]|nr:amidohydrolase family protein [Gemmatimonadales bacterium]
MTTPSAPVTPGRFSSAPALVAAVLVAALLGACAEQGPPRTALMGATILDGRGGTPLRDGVVLVRGRTIEAIGPRENVLIPRGTTEIDVSGSWIIPGLIDAHAHVERWALQRYVAYGVTTVRDVHNFPDSIFALSEAADLGSGLLSPRIYAAGAMIDGVPATYPNATEVTDPRAARQAVDRLSVAGAHLVKAYTRITPELMEAITDEAETFRIPVAAHLGLTDAVTAAKLGVASIEHLSGVPEAAGRADPLFAAHRNGFFAGWTAFELSWATLDSVTLTRLAGQLAESKVTMVPTLVLHEVFSQLDDTASAANPDLLALPPGQMAAWNVQGMVERAGWTAADFAGFRRGRPMQDLFVRAFRQAGGRVVTGTDAANQMLVPGASEHTELELLVRAGLTPAQALAAATKDAAALLGADSLGVLTPGMAADLVVLSRDPMADITNTRSVTRVMVRGQLILADSIRNRW